MPDFTTHVAQVCRQLVQPVHRQVPNSAGTGNYTVYVRGADETCTCPGHRFRGKCKHVAAVRAALCSWDSEHSPQQQTPQQDMEGVCPCCGGETTAVRVAA